MFTKMTMIAVAALSASRVAANYPVEFFTDDKCSTGGTTYDVETALCQPLEDAAESATSLTHTDCTATIFASKDCSGYNGTLGLGEAEACVSIYGADWGSESPVPFNSLFLSCQGE